MSRSMEDFAATYANMSDNELTRIHADRESLLPEAVIALDAEYQKRRLGSSSDLEQPIVLEDVPQGNPRASSWWARLIIFLLWGFAGLLVFLFVVESNLAGDQEKLAESTTKMFLYSALALWGLSQTFASRLTIKRTMIVATVFYIVGIGVLAVAFHATDSQQYKMRQLLTDIASLGPPSQDFRQKLEQVVQQDPKDFAGFQQRENELEALLDSDSARVQKAQSLLKELQDLPTINQSSQMSSLPLVQRAYEDDSKVFAALREEIACAHVLSRSAVNERLQFRRICLDASQDKIRPLAEDEDTVMRELQQQGYKVPNP
jgi:hypothetical protein